MKTRFRFEMLEVWPEAGNINQAFYRLARKFPREELFAMTSQIRRASISVSSNFAEGSGRNSDQDFAHFPEPACGSLMDVVSVFYLALDEGYVKASDLNPLFDELGLAKRAVSLHCSLSVPTSKIPFRRTKPPALGSRLSTLD